MNTDTSGLNAELGDTKSCYIICIKFVLMRCITITYIHCETNLHKENIIATQLFSTKKHKNMTSLSVMVLL